MFEYMNKKSAVVKRVCTHKYVELIIAYINIAIVMGLFLWGYSCKYELKIQISALILIELPFVNRDVFLGARHERHFLTNPYMVIKEFNVDLCLLKVKCIEPATRVTCILMYTTGGEDT